MRLYFFRGKRNGFGIKPYLEGETPEKEAQDLEDGKIVGLYLMRSESAISETDAKYGSLMLTLSKRILGDGGAAEECLNDAYLGLWNSIPPEEPQNLRAYCCKVIRNLSFKDCNTVLRKSGPCTRRSRSTDLKLRCRTEFRRRDSTTLNSSRRLTLFLTDLSPWRGLSF